MQDRIYRSSRGSSTVKKAPRFTAGYSIELTLPSLVIEAMAVTMRMDPATDSKLKFNMSLSRLSKV